MPFDHIISVKNGHAYIRKLWMSVKSVTLPCGVGALWGGRHKIGNVTVSGRSGAQKWTEKKNMSKISLVIGQWFSTLGAAPILM